MARVDTGRYASVSGLEMYYEMHGQGPALVLVHGGFGVVDMFEPVISLLAKTRQVIAVELQGHGHTADIDRPLSFEFLADDIAALLAVLGLADADILGYSLGGGVAQQFAFRHPGLLRKLMIVSAPCKSSGWYPEVLAGMKAITAEIADTWIGSPMHLAYTGVAPVPENWRSLVEKTGRLLGQPYDWSEAVKTIQAPVLIAVGDADSVRTAHAVAFFELLGGGQQDAGWDGSGMSRARLAVLPATTHYNILASPLLASTLKQFLDESGPAAE